MLFDGCAFLAWLSGSSGLQLRYSSRYGSEHPFGTLKHRMVVYALSHFCLPGMAPVKSGLAKPNQGPILIRPPVSGPWRTGMMAPCFWTVRD